MTDERWPKDSALPSRFSWRPTSKEPEDKRLSVDFHEIGGDAADSEAYLEQIWTIAEHCKCSFDRETLLAKMTAVGYTVRVALRSYRSVVGLCISRHFATPDADLGYCANVIELLWVHPAQWETKVPLALVQMARLELPEFPTICGWAAPDADKEAFLRKQGWADISDEGRRTFAIAGPAGRKHTAAGAPSGPTRPCSAGDAT